MKDTDLLDLYYDVKDFADRLDELLASTSRPARYNQELQQTLEAEERIHAKTDEIRASLDLPKKRPPSDLTHE